MTELALGKKELAGDMLQLNIDGLRLDHDAEALEKSLYALARLRHQQGDHATARPLLEEALAKYPGSTSEVRGRFVLAETYRQLADHENQNAVQGGSLTDEARDHFLQRFRAWLTQAAEQYQNLDQRLGDPDVTTILTLSERVHVAFSLADCRVKLGEYATALKLYEELADRYRNRLEHLSALGGTARCYALQRDFDRYRSRLEDIREALKDVDEQTRRQWEAWLLKADKRE
jgi:hypothetical protein